MSEPIVVRIIFMDGREVGMPVDPDARVERLAQLVVESEDQPAATARLISAGHLLQRHKTLRECGIRDGSAVHAVLTQPENVPNHDAGVQGGLGWRMGGRDAAAGERREGDGGWCLEGILLMVPPGAMLALLWALFLYSGGEFFHIFSKTSLLGLTALYLFFLVPMITAPASRVSGGVAPPPQAGQLQASPDPRGLFGLIGAGGGMSPWQSHWAVKVAIVVVIVAVFVAF